MVIAPTGLIRGLNDVKCLAQYVEHSLFQVYNPFVHSFDKYFLNSEGLPGTILRAGNTMTHKNDKIPASVDLNSSKGKTGNKEGNL